MSNQHHNDSDVVSPLMSDRLQVLNSRVAKCEVDLRVPNDPNSQAVAEEFASLGFHTKEWLDTLKFLADKQISLEELTKLAAGPDDIFDGVGELPVSHGRQTSTITSTAKSRRRSTMLRMGSNQDLLQGLRAVPAEAASAEAAPAAVEATPVDIEAAPAGLPSVVTALYDYDPVDDGELSFASGEAITVIHKDESGWWTGTNAAGASGVFPGNYVSNDVNIEKAQNWVEQVLGAPFPDEFGPSLKDGNILCQLLNTIKPGCVSASKSKLAFLQMENVSNYLKVSHSLGVKHEDLFEQKDLFEQRDLLLVALQILALGAAVQVSCPEFQGYPCPI